MINLRVCGNKFDVASFMKPFVTGEQPEEYSKSVTLSRKYCNVSTIPDEIAEVKTELECRLTSDSEEEVTKLIDKFKEVYQVRGNILTRKKKVKHRGDTKKTDVITYSAMVVLTPKQIAAKGKLLGMN